MDATDDHDAVQWAMQEEVGDELRTARYQRKLTRRKLAGMLDLAVNTLSCYENGRRPVPLGRLAQICAVLRIDAGMLVNRAIARLGLSPSCPTCGATTPTSGGVVLTDEVIGRLAQEAEEGYDLDRLRPDDRDD
jgi:transcriptional regulator with XRE-family HTH domain